MGLFKRRPIHLISWLHEASHWQVAIGLAAASVAVGLTGETGRTRLMYQRLSIEDGEWWRLLTGHFAHLGTTHLVLNLAGLLLVWLLVGRHIDRSGWLLGLCVSIAAVSGGFWFLDTNMLWYVGLSGILHGFLVAGAIVGLRSLPTESVIILGIVFAKLGWEQLAGPLPGSESVSGGDVVVNSHLFGGIGGLLAGGIEWRRGMASRPI